MGLARHIFRARHALRWGRSFVRGLEAAERASPDELAALSWRRRVAMVEHCAAQVPFYRERFRSIGFEPGDLRGEADFAALPILEKHEVRAAQAALISDEIDPRRLPAGATGGSTGEPLRCYSDPRVPLSAMTWRMLAWWGVDPSDPSGYLLRTAPRGLAGLARAAVLWPTRRAHIAATEMGPENMRRFLRRLDAIGARYLTGYVGALDAFAEFVEVHGAAPRSLRAVWATAAPLPEFTRRRLERAFGCPVFDQYGSVEIYLIAAECGCRDGLHVASDLRHVEIVEGADPVAPGTEGEVVVSDLSNRAFPLLRYRIGDRGRLLEGPCACGRPFPRMGPVRGRISDRIHLSDGSSIAGEFWTTIFDDHPEAISGFAVRQALNGLIEVRYQPRPGGDAEGAVAAVRRALEAKVAGRAPLRFTPTRVDPNDGGKIRFVSSEIERRRQAERGMDGGGSGTDA